jgi:hypothetical protein
LSAFHNPAPTSQPLTSAELVLSTARFLQFSSAENLRLIYPSLSHDMTNLIFVVTNIIRSLTTSNVFYYEQCSRIESILVQLVMRKMCDERREARGEDDPQSTKYFIRFGPIMAF